MERPFVRKVEDFITAFVHSINGLLVTDCLGAPPDFDNADYYFKTNDIVIELKCLEKDLFSEEDLERNERLIDKWLDEKLITKADIIAIFLGKKQIPEQCLQEMFQLARKSFQRIIEKANKQLKVTKLKIGSEITQKVLMICNDGNYLFPHDLLFSLICDVIANRKEIDIDCIVYFTVNQAAFIEGSDLDWRVWMPAYGNNANEGLPPFIDEFGRQFNNFYNTVLHVEENEHKEFSDSKEGMETIAGMTFIPKEIIYKK